MLQGTLTYFSDGLRAAADRFHRVLSDVSHPQHPRNIPGYRNIHTAFADGLQRYTMLSASLKPQYRKLRDLIRIALELPSVALAVTPSPSAVQSLVSQFKETRQYIIDSLLSMLHGSHIVATSARLDTSAQDVAHWPSQSQWAQELLARIDPTRTV